MPVTTEQPRASASAARIVAVIIAVLVGFGREARHVHMDAGHDAQPAHAD